MGQISELKCSWFLLSPLFVFLPLSTLPWKLFSAASRMSPAHCTSLTRSWQWVLVNSSAYRRRTWCYRCGCLICRRKTSFLDLSNVIAGKVNLRRRHAGGKTMFRLFSSPPSLRRQERLFFPLPPLFAVLPSDPFKTHLSPRSSATPLLRFEQALYLNVHGCTAGFELWCVCACAAACASDGWFVTRVWSQPFGAGPLGLYDALVLWFIFFFTAKSFRPPPPRCGPQPSPRAPADRLPALTLKEFKTSSPDTLRCFVTRWYFERDTSPCGLIFTVLLKPKKPPQHSDTNRM